MTGLDQISSLRVAWSRTHEPSTFFLRNFRAEFWPYHINYYGIVYLNSAKKNQSYCSDMTGRDQISPLRVEWSRTHVFFSNFLYSALLLWKVKIKKLYPFNTAIVSFKYCCWTIILILYHRYSLIPNSIFHILSRLQPGQNANIAGRNASEHS